MVILYRIRQEMPFTDRDARSLLAFANQSALAIENALLFFEARRKAIQLEVAGEVSRRVSSILDPDELLAEIVRLIREKFGYYHVHVFLIDGHANQLVLQEISGEKDDALRRSGLRLEIGGKSITGWTAASGEPLICNDVSREPRYHPHELLEATRSEAAIPLLAAQTVVGVLDVQSDRLNAFEPDDVIALQIVADQVAIAIENAHLFSRSQHQVEVLRGLHDISLKITSQLGADILMQTILEQAAYFLNARGSSLGMYLPERKRIRKVASHNLPWIKRGLELEIGEGVSGQVIATGKPVFVNHYESWKHRSKRLMGGPYNAVLGVPVFWDNEVIGELVVVDHAARRPFTAADAQLLGLVADLASIALKNAELFDQIRRASEQLERTVEKRTNQLSKARESLAKKADELRQLLALTIKVQEEERSRIALDLHDGSNQLITGALFELEAAKQSVQNQHRDLATQKLETAKALLRKIEAENRKIISGLRPIILHSEGLLAAMTWLTEIFEADFGIRCSLRIRGEPFPFSEEVETAIFRIVQESLTNIVKHSGAQTVLIRAEFGQDGFSLLIRDDGNGFQIDWGNGEWGGQIGIIGMRERAQSIQGHLTVESRPGRGTRVSLAVPAQHS